jgi:RNA polymerase sigma factor (sigma-70 family)
VSAALAEATIESAEALWFSAGITREEPAAESFEEVFRRVLPRAVRIARRILGDETQAEDAAAEALARAHASWKKVGSTSYCEAWILRVTANVAVDMGRTRKRSLLVHLRLAEGVEERRDSEADLDRVALSSALAGLSRREREVVVLRYLEGFSEEEIATALGVSAGTVKKTAFRARERLRSKLGPDFGR